MAFQVPNTLTGEGNMNVDITFDSMDDFSPAAVARKVDALKRGSRAFATMRRLAMRFNGILRGRQPEPLEAWIDDAIDSNLVSIMRFARVLRRDIDAVYNAIELPWSNGQAEGQINRFKTLKRAMYGRAGTELLEQECCRFAT